MQKSISFETDNLPTLFSCGFHSFSLSFPSELKYGEKYILLFKKIKSESEGKKKLEKEKKPHKCLFNLFNLFFQMRK